MSVYIFTAKATSHMALTNQFQLIQVGKKRQPFLALDSLTPPLFSQALSSHGYLINVKPCFNINIPSYNYSLCHAIHYNMPFHTKFSGLSLL